MLDRFIGCARTTRISDTSGFTDTVCAESAQGQHAGLLPEFRNRASIRFTSPENPLSRAASPWGRHRVIHLQYASAAVPFFDPGALSRRAARPRCLAGLQVDHGGHSRSMHPALSLALLGVVFGDIGTSPIKIFRECTR
jgi:hypothetical protein